MAEFDNIPIGTSNPVNLCKGLALLPGPIAPLRAGITQTQRSEPFFSTAATILFSRMKVFAYYELLMGVCGPSLAYLLADTKVSTANQGDEGELTVTLGEEQEMLAGIFAGFVFGGGVQVELDEYLPSSWYSPWKFKWRSVFKVRAGFEIDFLELFAELIAYLLEEGSDEGLFERNETAERLLEKGSSWMFFGESRSTLLDDPVGEMQAIPKLKLPVNLGYFVPALSEVIIELHSVKGELAFGPILQVELPVTMRLESFTVEGGQGEGSSATYGDLLYEGEEVVATGPAFTSAPTRLTTNASWTVDFDLTLSWYFKVSACKIFEFSMNFFVADLLNALRIPHPTIASYHGGVTTMLEGGCILVPAVTLTFSPATCSSDQPPGVAEVGCAVTGTVTLTGVTSYDRDEPLTIYLSSDVPVVGLPPSVQIAPHASPAAATFQFYPVNRCIPTTNPDGSTTEYSPTPLSPDFTVNVTAKVDADFDAGCGTPTEVTQALRVRNRVFAMQIVPPAGSQPTDTGPVWNPIHGGGVVNVNPSAPSAPGATRYALIYPFAPVPLSGPPYHVTVSLLDENRCPVTSQQLGTGPDPHIELWYVTGYPSGSKFPFPTAFAFQSTAFSFQIHFDTVGRQTNYSRRYILVVDMGCQGGQSEYWINVWNWAGNDLPSSCDG